jgi:hypothetical protein
MKLWIIGVALGLIVPVIAPAGIAAESGSKGTSAARASGDAVSPLSRITISDPIFALNVDRPTFSFTVSNQSNVAIKKIFFTATLQSPNRSVPWAEDNYPYSISGGIEPGETQKLDVRVSGFSVFGQLSKEVEQSSVLKIVLHHIEDAAGTRIPGDGL